MPLPPVWLRERGACHTIEWWVASFSVGAQHTIQIRCRFCLPVCWQVARQCNAESIQPSIGHTIASANAECVCAMNMNAQMIYFFMEFSRVRVFESDAIEHKKCGIRMRHTFKWKRILIHRTKSVHTYSKLHSNYAKTAAAAAAIMIIMTKCRKDSNFLSIQCIWLHFTSLNM